jgi:hypothetical protein
MKKSTIEYCDSIDNSFWIVYDIEENKVHSIYRTQKLAEYFMMNSWILNILSELLCIRLDNLNPPGEIVALEELYSQYMTIVETFENKNEYYYSKKLQTIQIEIKKICDPYCKDDEDFDPYRTYSISIAHGLQNPIFCD